MKKSLLLFLIVVSSALAFSQTEKYSKVKIYTDEQGLKKLSSLGLAVDEGIYRKDMFLISDFSETELGIIRSNSFKIDILVDDVISEYLKKNEELSKLPIQGDLKLSRDYPVPYEFELGSMGGFCTWEQFIGHLDYMYATYPGLVSQKVSLGQTLENRSLYMVKITGNASRKDPKPQVLYTGMHHAREPIGMMQLLYYMYYLLENYNTDPEIKYLVDNTEMYFVPILNPDGYKYNQTTSPSGGGMWRKNRRNNGGGIYGVDINRNYGYMWGGDGSSGYPDDETYRGTAPFSENENQAIKTFCESHQFGIAINYHSVSALLLYPWGYTNELCLDNTLFNKQAQKMTGDSHYTYGPGYSTIYVTSGGSDDWMYGEQTSKNKILSYTPEIGGSGFWPYINEIIPLCQENMLTDLMAARFVHNYGSIKDESSSIISQNSGYLKFSVTQLGLDSTTSFSVSITPLGSEFLNIGDSVILGGIAPGNSILDSISFTLDPGIQAGTTLSYILKLNDGGMVRVDTIHKIFGQPMVLFNDLCSNLTNWTPGGWAITTSAFHSAPACITDSPGGNYQNNINKSITLTNTVDLTTAAYGLLNFWAKWDIEAGYDYTQVKISTNGGTTWTPLAGNYTHPGTSYQDPGNPVYDGQQLSWVMESIDLTPYLGHNIKLRFTLVSDGNVTGDGFYFDDVSVITIGAPIGHLVSGLISYPNTNNTPLSGIQLNLRNNQGNIVASIVTNPSGNYSFTGIADGTYIIEASSTKPWDGVTAADVLLYKKHIAGIAPLTGIFLASGDVNGSSSLTASDVLLIRKRIISMIDSFTVGDWLFNPEPVIVSGGNVTQSFNGLTYGDANGSYQPVALKNIPQPVEHKGEIMIGSVDPFMEQISVPVHAFDLNNVGSFQFTIHYDPQKLTFQSITDVYPGLESVMVGSPKPGVLTFVWVADELGINVPSGSLFNLLFISRSDKSSELTFSDTPAIVEFGDFEGNIFLPELKSGIIGHSSINGITKKDGFTVYPNPNHGVFTIISQGISTETINIIVTDPVGKNVYQQKDVVINAGQDQQIDLGSLPGGIYLLTVEGKGQKFIEKIVILQ
ncbi:MAG: immune inhibitor A [Bacteroidales bacterium]|jgi:hypothetical protein|nr:immune inhibitor A [Bacteroidales bacterium]